MIQKKMILRYVDFLQNNYVQKNILSFYLKVGKEVDFNWKEKQRKINRDLNQISLGIKEIIGYVLNKLQKIGLLNNCCIFICII